MVELAKNQNGGQPLPRFVKFTHNSFISGVHSSPSDSELTFTCPEEFGYYPHPDDCSKYFVCVFGGPLLETCTVGLMYR